MLRDRLTIKGDVAIDTCTVALSILFSKSSVTHGGFSLSKVEAQGFAFSGNTLDATGRELGHAERYLKSVNPDAKEAAEFQFHTSTFQKEPSFSGNKFKGGRVASWDVTANLKPWVVPLETYQTQDK